MNNGRCWVLRVVFNTSLRLVCSSASARSPDHPRAGSRYSTAVVWSERHLWRVEQVPDVWHSSNDGRWTRWNYYKRNRVSTVIVISAVVINHYCSHYLIAHARGRSWTWWYSRRWEKKLKKTKAQVLGIAPLNMRSMCQRRFTIVEVVTDQHWL